MKPIDHYYQVAAMTDRQEDDEAVAYLSRELANERAVGYREGYMRARDAHGRAEYLVGFAFTVGLLMGMVLTVLLAPMLSRWLEVTL